MNTNKENKNDNRDNSLRNSNSQPKAAKTRVSDFSTRVQECKITESVEEEGQESAKLKLNISG